ncbi:MAG: DUF1761 domain-containing protein [Hyphomonas sp.]|nr:DUF1761 domain-containing protein [Hyphomonas sp.]
MPRILGVNAVGALLAAVAMFFVGFLVYGALFTEVYMSARGFQEADFEGNGPAWMGVGFLIELVAAFGIAWVIKARGTKGLVPCLLTGLTLAILIALPMRSYEFVYGWRHDVPGLLIDWAHSLVGFSVAGAVLSFFD